MKQVVILGGNNQPTGEIFLPCLGGAFACSWSSSMPGVSDLDVADTEHGSVPGLKCAQLSAQCGGASSYAAS